MCHVCVVVCLCVGAGCAGVFALCGSAVVVSMMLGLVPFAALVRVEATRTAGEYVSFIVDYRSFIGGSSSQIWSIGYLSSYTDNMGVFDVSITCIDLGWHLLILARTHAALLPLAQSWPIWSSGTWRKVRLCNTPLPFHG